MKKSRITIMMLICLGLLMQASIAMAVVNDVDTQGNVTKDEKEIKRLNKDGTVPDKWNLPKPKAVPHPDVPPESAGVSASVIGDGQNSISFTTFSTGNPIVGLGTPTGHAGEWDASKYNGLDVNCIWSALKDPDNRVQLEAPRKYRSYDEAYGLWVYGATTAQRVAAKDYCAAQNGEPYIITSLKNNQSAWYCSKLVWASWKYTAANKDLDGDGGLYVWPVDLVNDNDTMIHTYSS